MVKGLLWMLWYTGFVCLVAGGGGAETRTIVLGGETGLDWTSGGGGGDPVVRTGVRDWARGNTPGGVIDFEREGRQGWISPRRVDPERNLAPGILDRGGSVRAPNVLESGIDEQLALMIDNDGTTALDRKNVTIVRGMAMQFDLGARFGVDRIRFFPRNAHLDFPAPYMPFQEDYIRGYELFLNDGSEETQTAGYPDMLSFTLEPANDEPVVDLRIPPQHVRFIRLTSRTAVGFEIAEFQVFGTGFVPTATYVSDIFDMGADLALAGNIRWVEESIGREGFSAVRVRTHAGSDDTPLLFTRKHTPEPGRVKEVPWKENAEVRSGDSVVNLDEFEIDEAFQIYRSLPREERGELELTPEGYSRLRSSDKGEIQDDLDAWTQWSSPYSLEGVKVTADNIEDEEVGVPILSPGPRRYLQFRIDFLSDELESAAEVGPFAFTLSSPPRAERILGEISPRQVDLGAPTTFTYAVMPTKIRPGVDTGFDSFVIVTPVRVEGVDRIEVTFPDGGSESADFSGTDLSSLPVYDKTERFAITALEDRRFEVQFPAIRESDLEAEMVSVLNIRFRCRVLRYGTKFSGFAKSSLEAAVGQEVIPGNVALLDELDDDIVPMGTETQRGLSVDVPIEGKEGLLIDVRADPRPFSPNGDGVNDVTDIGLDISRLLGAAPVRVTVYDLSGRPVKLLFSGDRDGGHFSVPWTGTDDGGNLLPPGIYLLLVSLDSDAGEQESIGTVELVY